MKQNILQGRMKQILPDNVSSGMVDYFFYKETIETYMEVDRYEIYVSCTWDEASFNNEKERLMSLTGHLRNPIMSNDLFCYPACVYLYNYRSIYWYVLFDEPNLKMHYVMLSEIGSLDEVVFNKELAPTKCLYDADFPRTYKEYGYFYS